MNTRFDTIDYTNMTDSKIDKQASSFFNKNLTNADNDNSMNISTKMDMSLVK